MCTFNLKVIEIVNKDLREREGGNIIKKLLSKPLLTTFKNDFKNT